MSKRILVVEDQEDNRQIIRDMAASSIGSLLPTFFATGCGHDLIAPMPGRFHLVCVMFSLKAFQV
jgi:hypothetical protein